MEWFKEISDFSSLEEKISIDRGIFLVGNENQTKTQSNVSESFGYQWSKRNVFDTKETENHMKEWLTERFGTPDNYISKKQEHPIIMLDAGCGASMSALSYFGKELLVNVRYVGIDVSKSVFVAKEKFDKLKLKNSCFIKSDLNTKIFNNQSVDLIFSEGVLHHTDNAEQSFYNLCKLLKPGGKFVFYIYKKKAPIREFSDDFIREAIKGMTPDEKYQALFPLTKLGKTLGELNLEVNISEPIDFLGIPAGQINIQRLFFYYIFKCFYKSSWTTEQMNLTNFDWYSPINCSRHTTKEVGKWIAKAKMKLLHEYEDDSGISYVVQTL